MNNNTLSRQNAIYRENLKGIMYAIMEIKSCGISKNKIDIDLIEQLCDIQIARIQKLLNTLNKRRERE